MIKEEFKNKLWVIHKDNTFVEMSEKSEISLTCLHNWSKHNANPTLETAEMLLKKYGYKLEIVRDENV